MLTFLLVVHALITATLVGVILMQRSEGGGLGMGGSPTGLMSARGAADFLTRATTILATLFVALSIASAVVASRSAAPRIDTSLTRNAPPIVPPPVTTPTPAVPLGGDAGTIAGSGTAPANGSASAPANAAAATPAPIAKPIETPATKTAPFEGTLRKPAPPVAVRPSARATPPIVVPTTPAPQTPPPANAN